MSKEEQFNDIIKYAQQQLMIHTTTPVENIVDLKGVCTYEGYVASTKVKGKKIHIKQFLTEDWKKFWNTWPSTKSVPGTQYKSGAKMKGQELKMHEKWYNAIYEYEKITLEQMQYAAECYLAWAYEDSKRLGRNELHYRNGMEPWLNQEQYLLFKDVEMPKQNKPVQILQNSIDM